MESLCIFAIQTQKDDQEPKKCVLDFIFPLYSTVCCGLSFFTFNGIADCRSFGHNFCKSIRPHLIFIAFLACRKAISGLFTAVMLLTILVGNSSFIAEALLVETFDADNN